MNTLHDPIATRRSEVHHLAQAWRPLACTALWVALLAVPPEGQTLRLAETHRMLPGGGGGEDSGHSLHLVDVDGDSDLDALVARSGQNSLYLNDGAGLFTDVTASHLPALDVATTCLAAGDVDGDGDPDILIGSERQNRLFLNDGDGVFSDETGPTGGPVGRARRGPRLPRSSATYAVALEDVDGDGDLDAYFGRTGQDQLCLNTGDGTFLEALPPLLPLEEENTTTVTLEDVDGDGDPDAVIGNSGYYYCDRVCWVWYDEPNRIYLNDGTGRFVDGGARLPDDVGDPNTAALEDVDGDGDRDLLIGAVAECPDGTNRLLLNDGAGFFAYAPSVQFPTNHALGFLLADLDQDGDLDALSRGGFCGQRDGLYRNDGAGTFVDVSSTHLPAPSASSDSMVVGDVDGDGDADILHANGYRALDRMAINDGTGRFADVPMGSMPEDGEYARALALEDVDGDGDRDAFVANSDFSTPQQSRLYVNDGFGNFRDVTTTSLPLVGAQTRALALEDVDGDGDRDAFLGNGGSGHAFQSFLYLNDGAGQFSDVTATHLPALPLTTQALALVDVDGDGDRDALLGCRGAQSHLQLNDGLGHFVDVTATHLPAAVYDTRAVALGDVDGDGDADALLGNAHWGNLQNRLYLNNGAGVFTDVTASHLPADADHTYGLALADLDADGDLDALIGNQGQCRLYRNGGNGVFGDATATHLPAEWINTACVEVGDIDGDGDLDAFLGSGFLWGADRLYRNDGTGRFDDATAALPETRNGSEAAAIADVDQDGDMDLVLGKWGQDRLITNLARQLVWRALPRIGRALDLDIYGPPGEPWSVALSSGRGMLTPSGSQRCLGPAGMPSVVATGYLDAEGRGTAHFEVPNDLALVGTRWLWNARIGAPAANVPIGRCADCLHEVTTLTNL